MISIVDDDASIEVDLAYWTDMLSDTQAAHVAEAFVQALTVIVEDPGCPLPVANLLSDHDSRHIRKWNSARDTRYELDSTCTHRPPSGGKT